MKSKLFILFFYSFQFMKYAIAFKESWENLCSMSRSGLFTPNNIQDVITTLNDLINKNHLIDEQVALQYYKQINHIDVFKLKAVDREENNEKCLFVGIAILTKVVNKQSILDGYCNFIVDFYNKFDSSVRRCFVIFDKTHTITENDAISLRTFQKTYRVKVYSC